jgi:glutathione synthase
MGPAGVEGGEVISELGVLGSCLWRAPDAPGSQHKLLSNSVAGWTFKTKHADIDEMSVVKGFGCFDTPHLIGDTNVQ